MQCEHKHVCNTHLPQNSMYHMIVVFNPKRNYFIWSPDSELLFSGDIYFVEEYGIDNTIIFIVIFFIQKYVEFNANQYLLAVRCEQDFVLKAIP